MHESKWTHWLGIPKKNIGIDEIRLDKIKKKPTHHGKVCCTIRSPHISSKMQKF